MNAWIVEKNGKFEKEFLKMKRTKLKINKI